MADLMGAGDFIPWEGGCMLIGKAHAITPMHSHYALQIGVGAEHGIRFRTDDSHEWTSYDAAIIPSRQPHTMDATQVSTSAIIFVEPETPAGRAITERYSAGGIAEADDTQFRAAAGELFKTWCEHGTKHATAAAADAVINTMSGGARPRVVSDERVMRAVSYINSHLDRQLTLQDVAREACLSPSRFRHLFIEQTGTALRPYMLWRRFLLSWEVVMRGDSLSAAAHAAGFADAAHLTRTSHRMFGFPPSALQINARR